MIKRINWIAVLKLFTWVVCLAGVVVLMSFISVKKHEVKCIDVKILIPGADNFIEREEIDAILKHGEGQLIGRSLSDIDIYRIEATLKANPYIAFAKVYADMDGVINIEIKQRQPVLRILNAGGQDYYIDHAGLKMPMSANFTADVLVASGNILEGFSGRVDTLLTPLASDLYKTALFIKRDTLWDAQIEQLFVNERNDIELIPRVGNQRIILGNADSLETKMTNLLAFYKQAMPMVGWNAYSTINLKYTNQIVCEKVDSLHQKKANVVAVVDTVPGKKAVDSVVRTQLRNEIKKAISEAAAEKPAIKPGTTNSTKPVATKSTVVAPVKSGATTGTAIPKTSPTVKEKVPAKINATTPKKNNAKDAIEPKSAAAKEKTDTKKPL